MAGVSKAHDVGVGLEAQKGVHHVLARIRVGTAIVDSSRPHAML